MKHFATELLKFLKGFPIDIKQFILDDWKQNHSRVSFNHYFQEVFLYKTGARSIDTVPIIGMNGWAAYITFRKENLYHEEKGIKKLSIDPISQKQAEVRIANYFINTLPFMLLENVKEALNK
jgi:hypothetical protein